VHFRVDEGESPTRDILRLLEKLIFLKKKKKKKRERERKKKRRSGRGIISII